MLILPFVLPYWVGKRLVKRPGRGKWVFAHCGIIRGSIHNGATFKIQLADLRDGNRICCCHMSSRATAMPSDTPPLSEPIPASFQKIQRFVVLVLENRSFDHLFGYLKAVNPAIEGVTGNEANYPNPNSPQSPPVKVHPATQFVMSFDPAHEFMDVQMQLYGPSTASPAQPNPPANPAAMSGFVCDATTTAQTAGVCRATPRASWNVFTPDQVPCLTTLAQQFALFNFWHSSLPGLQPGPNRFFASFMRRLPEG